MVLFYRLVVFIDASMWGRMASCGGLVIRLAVHSGNRM
jgi:hypothetical protein